MASNVMDDYLIVAAIDFGTTFSGYAFSMKTNQHKIFMNKDWGYGHAFTTLKTPTSILTDKGCGFRAFGYEAEKQFSESASEDECDVHLFQHFKMELHKLEALDKKITVKSKDGNAFAMAFDLVSMALCYMKDCLLSQVSKQGIEILPHDVRWVVTVPAIWSDVSKRFMREAAFKGGLIPDVNSSQLLIALEPEAAAIYCRSLDADNLAVETSDTNVTMPVGTKYLVVDVGGGTVDIAVHQVTDPTHAKELFYPSGGSWGGNRVNKSFEDLLAKILGDDVVKTFKHECPYAWWEFIQQFESKKRTWVDSKHLTVPLSNVLATKYQEVRDERIEEAFVRGKSLGVALSQGFIRCKPDAMRGIFDEAVGQTIRHLEDLVKDPRVKGVSTMMLVGGFSESPYLQSAIRDRFSSKMQILIPQQASLSVVKGAVLFGHQPATIQSRCAAKTYGTGTNTAFQKGVHPVSKRIEVEGKYYCKDVFSTFVNKGTMTELGEEKTFMFYPLRSTSTSVAFVLYNADKDSVEYTDEDEVEKMNVVTLPMPDTSRGKDRPIEVKVSFGGTEILVTATDVSTHKGLTAEGTMFFDTSSS